MNSSNALGPNPQPEITTKFRSNQKTPWIFRIIPLYFMISILAPIVINVGSVVLMPHRILLILIFFPLLIYLFLSKKIKAYLFDYILMTSTLWSTLSIFISDGHGMVEAIGVLWLEFLGAYLIGRICIRNSSDFLYFVKFYFFTVIFLLPFAASEAILGRPVFLDLLPNSINATYTHDRWGLRRAQTAFAHPILFGVYISSAFGLFVFVIRPIISKTCAILATVVNTVLSLSTGALLSLVVQAAFIGWEILTRPSRLRWWTFGVLAILGYMLIDLLSNRTPFHVLVSYASFNTGSAYSRILIWEWGLDNVALHPWFGLGLDIENWERPWWKSGSADNYWLLLAMTYGIPAVVLYALALVILLVQIARANLVDKLLNPLRSGYLVSIGGIIIAGGTVHYWHSMQAFVMFFTGSGVWLIQSAKIEENSQKENRKEPIRKSSRYSRFNNISSNRKIE